MAELEKILQEIVVGIDLESQDFIGDGLLDSFALMSLIGALKVPDVRRTHCPIFSFAIQGSLTNSFMNIWC